MPSGGVLVMWRARRSVFRFFFLVYMYIFVRIVIEKRERKDIPGLETRMSRVPAAVLSLSPTLRCDVANRFASRGGGGKCKHNLIV